MAKKKKKIQKKQPIRAASPRNTDAYALGFSAGQNRLRLRYDAANPNDPDNEEHWARGVDNHAADVANSPAVRKRIRQRARYESDNNSYLAGVIDTLVNDTVGGLPRLQLSKAVGIPESIAKLAEADWIQWLRDANVSEAFQVIGRSKIIDGEGFGVLSQDSTVPGLVNLRLIPIEADQVTDPDTTNDPRNQDGLLLDTLGNVVKYRMLTSHPGGMGGGKNKSVEYPAWRVVHWFKRRRPGQYRGISDLVSCLKLMPMLRRYTLATVRSAEVQAANGGVIECEADEEIGPDNTTLAEDIINFERGNITALPSGFTFRGFDPTQPTANMDMFIRTLLQEAGRGLNVPLVVMLMNASGFNFASGRLDHLIYLKGRRIDRTAFANRVISPVFLVWWREWKLARGLPSLPDRPREEFIFPGFEFLDILKESTAYINMMEKGLLTPPDVWMMLGKDPEQAKEDAEYWAKWRREHGIACDDVVSSSPAEHNDMEDEDDESPQDKTA